MSSKPPPSSRPRPTTIKKPAPPVTPQKVREQRKATARLVRRLSEDSLRSPMGPDHVTLDFSPDEDGGEAVQKRVYVTEVNGTRQLDLYSGWNPETNRHKFPLRALPAKVCSLVSVQRLWVSHNLLSSLPSDLDRLVNLKELFLHHNNFEEFPASLCSLRSLEILWLSNNRIRSIPSEISQVKTLKRLHLDENWISELPPALCTLTSLEVLYLNVNELEVISEDIGNLTNLKRLYLQNNKIKEIPLGICKLKALKMLYLDDNDIHHLTNEFKTFKSLSQESNGAIISLDNNPFSFSTPRSKSKPSLGSLGSQGLTIKARRYSDQHEQDLVARRPLRVSLPGTRPSESLPAELHLHAHYQSRPMFGEYKADTLPRSGAMKTRRSTYTYHEH